MWVHPRRDNSHSMTASNGGEGPALDRRDYFDALTLATSNLLGVRVPAVCQDLGLVDFQHLLRRDGYGVQHVTVVGVVADVMMNDQPALDVDHALRDYTGRGPRHWPLADQMAPPIDLLSRTS